MNYVFIYKHDINKPGAIIKEEEIQFNCRRMDELKNCNYDNHPCYGVNAFRECILALLETGIIQKNYLEIC